MTKQASTNPYIPLKQDMLSDKNIIDKQITEEELDMLYAYLDLSWEEISEEEKLVWATIMQTLDKNFQDNEV